MQIIKALLSSRKFVVAIAGTLAAALLRLGFTLDSDAILSILSPIIAYVLSQGLADSSK